MHQKQLLKVLFISFIFLLTLGGIGNAAVEDLSHAGTAAMESLDDIGNSIAELPDKINSMMPRPNFKMLVKQAGPAVVNISTERTANVRSMPFPFGPDMFRGNPFGEEFFSPWGGEQGEPMQRKQSSLGSGFIISADGYIVTNNHVVEGAEVIRVNFEGNGEGQEISYDATIIGTDKETDLALLKIEAEKSLPFITFGDSDKIEVGEWVVAIGNPFGLDHTVTAGILSAKFRNIGSNTLVRFLQTDASINPGNSGGPLINMEGQVIGINTAIVAQGQGIGFAIPSTLAAQVIDDLKADRKVSRGWLGVSIQNVDQATAKALGLPKAGGALIGGLIPGQPAEKAGLEPGDVVLKVDGKEIATSDELMRTIANKKPDETVQVEIWRDGKTLTKEIILAERNQEQADAEQGKTDKQDADTSINSLGLRLRPITDQEATRLRLNPKQGGLIILQVDPSKLARQAGLQRGDVILAVGRTPVKSVEEFRSEVLAMSKKQGAIMLHLYRNGQQFIRSIEMDAEAGK